MLCSEKPCQRCIHFPENIKGGGCSVARVFTACTNTVGS